MKTLLVAAAVVLPLALAGCPQLAQITAADTAQAVAIANAAGDTAGAQCFGGFNKLVTAAGGTVTMGPAGTAMQPASGLSPQIATKIEVLRGVRQIVQDDCGAVAADLLENVLHGAAGPLAGLVP